MAIDARRFKTAKDAPDKDRAVGAALGSGVSNFVTGTLASPFLFSKNRRFSPRKFRVRPWQHLKRLYGLEALGSGAALAGVSMIGGAMKEQVQASYEKRQKKASDADHQLRINRRLNDLLRKARAHTGALVGGGVGASVLGFSSQRRLGAAFGGMAGLAAGATIDRARQEKTAGGTTGSMGHSGDLLRVSAPVSAETGAGDKVERRRPKRKRVKKANGDMLAHYQDLARRARKGDEKAKASLERREKREREKKGSQFGIMVYQRDPHELPESKRPPNPKGRMARMFGTKMHPAHAMHRRSQRLEDEWMGENGEFVEIGRRPGVMEAMQEVLGVQPDQVLSRKDVMGMVAERAEAKKGAFALRRTRRKAKEHAYTHSPDDLSEVLKVFEDLLENPQAKYFQVVG